LVSVFVHRLALLAAVGSALTYLIVWPLRQNQDPGTETRQGDKETRRQGDEEATDVVRDARRETRHSSRIAFALLTAVLAGAAVAGLSAGFSRESRGAGGHISAGPLQGLWLSFAHFSTDRGDIAGFLGLPLLVWMLPCVALTIAGLVPLLRAAARRNPVAI